MLERAKEVTRRGQYTYVEYARFADDLVILVDAYPQHDWLLKAVEQTTPRGIGQPPRHASTRRRAGSSTWPKGKASDSWALTSAACGAARATGGRSMRPQLKKRTALLRKLKDDLPALPVPAGGSGDRI